MFNCFLSLFVTVEVSNAYANVLSIIVRSTSAYQSNVAIIPRVVIHQRGAVGHACDLVTVVPPAHHTSLAVRVLGQPVVSFSEIVKDLPRPAARQKKKVSP
jgi:hypothetical protein